MKRFWSLSIALCSLVVGPVYGQDANQDCQVGRLDLQSSSNATTTRTQQTDVTNPTPAIAVEPSTEAEAYVQDVIRNDGLHVVHFWAPWCSNSERELGHGWAELVSDNPAVTFTFVTVWNDGEKGASLLDEYNIPDRVVEVTQPDLGPSKETAKRRRSFLGLPITWIPSTWIFHQNGELAFAMNYGEMEMETIQSLIDATRTEW